jgi:nitroreductase
MNFLELAKNRFSSRSYKPQPVERETIKNVLEAARIAPSAANKQPWHFLVFTRQESLKKAYQLYHREWFKQSPVVILACAEKQQAWTRAEDNKNHADIDLAIAIDHITLQATELGLATCWICNFFVEKTKQMLNLPQNLEPIALLTLAYPADIPDVERHKTQRKKLEEIVSWENFD